MGPLPAGWSQGGRLGFPSVATSPLPKTHHPPKGRGDIQVLGVDHPWLWKSGGEEKSARYGTNTLVFLDQHQVIHSLSKPAFFLIKTMPVRHRRSTGYTPPYLFWENLYSRGELYQNVWVSESPDLALPLSRNLHKSPAPSQPASWPGAATKMWGWHRLADRMHYQPSRCPSFISFHLTTVLCTDPVSVTF